MRRLLLRWGHRSGGLIRERCCAARGVRRIDEGDVSPRLESIRRQRTIPGVEYAKGSRGGGALEMQSRGGFYWASDLQNGGNGGARGCVTGWALVPWTPPDRLGCGGGG